ncbi:MAG: hypothetical protein JXR77_17890 [Lentisphaeria bacterium]|nr:hypothetical protein [Lentisphaeria bacterium]
MVLQPMDVKHVAPLERNASVESAANDTIMLASFPAMERERTASSPSLWSASVPRASRR